MEIIHMQVQCPRCHTKVEARAIKGSTVPWTCPSCGADWKITNLPKDPGAQASVQEAHQLLDQALNAVARMSVVEEVLVHMFGAEPEALELRQGDAFSITTDLRPLCRAVGGKWAELVDRVEAGEKERKANTLASSVTRDELNEKWKQAPRPEPMGSV